MTNPACLGTYRAQAWLILPNDPVQKMFDEQKFSVHRKQLILRLCARRVAQALALEVSAPEVQAVIDDFRIRRGLFSSEQMGDWLQANELDHETFVRAMIDCALVNKIDQVWDSELARELPAHLRMSLAEENRDVTAVTDPAEKARQTDWLQINLSLERRQGDPLPAARALFARLLPAVESWRRRGALEIFFFVRKPPDVRLRFQTQAPRAQLLAELESMLSGLMREGYVRQFFPSIYEPEIRQFGGREAMEFVHRYFAADSLAWIALDQLAAQGARSTADDRIVLAVMNDLFLRTLACPFEVWDVWCNLADLMPPNQVEPPGEMEPVLIHSLLAAAPQAEKQVLQDYCISNEQLSAGLRQVWNAGKLQCGLRAILPFVAMFHFNRHGLDGSRQAALSQAMSRAWNPKCDLRGVVEEPPISIADSGSA